MEEVLFETESAHNRGDIADYLEQVAENLRHGDGEITLVSGNDEITLKPPERAVFEVKVEREEEGGEEEMSVEFEIEWEVGGGGVAEVGFRSSSSWVAAIFNNKPPKSHHGSQRRRGERTAPRLAS